jgi:hypothetical protein
MTSLKGGAVNVKDELEGHDGGLKGRLRQAGKTEETLRYTRDVHSERVGQKGWTTMRLSAMVGTRKCCGKERNVVWRRRRA